MTGPGRVVTLGDALVDVIVETGGAAVPDDDVEAEIAIGPGGQAANVAAWVAYLGAPASLITVLGTDPAGRLVRDALEGRGVVLHGPETAATGTVVSLVSSDGRRTMLSDRRPDGGLRGADLEAAWFAGAGWLHLSGYALLGSGDSGDREAALAASALAVPAGARISVDLSAATLVSACGSDFVRALLRAVRADLVFGNELEFETLGAFDGPTLVIKRGARGCRVVTGGQGHDVPATPPVAVRDTTGAGDAFAAGWLVGGVGLATATAAVCVARAGAMPPEGVKERSWVARPSGGT
jgi:sugar/nucleoside kinase (ribokinase family)